MAKVNIELNTKQNYVKLDMSLTIFEKKKKTLRDCQGIRALVKKSINVVY